MKDAITRLPRVVKRDPGLVRWDASVYAPGNHDLAESFPEGAGETRERIARLVGTNGHYVTDGQRIREKAPEVFEEVKAGRLTIPVAREVANLDGEACREALRAALEAGRGKAAIAVRAVAWRDSAARMRRL